MSRDGAAWWNRFGYVKINGEMRCDWRAVDHEGEVLDSCVTRKRDKSEALRFLKKAPKRHGKAEATVSGGPRSNRAAMLEPDILDRREWVAG